MKCEKYQDMISDALYNELGATELQEFENHIASCKSCKKEFEEMKSVLGIVEQRIQPEREDFYWDNFWNKLEPEIENIESKKTSIKDIFSNLFSKPIGQLGAAVALVLLGLLIGKFVYTNQPVTLPVEETFKQPNVVNASLQQRTDRYLERSKILLLGLVNLDPSEVVENINLKHQKEISRELVREAADLKKEYKRHSRKHLRKLINDLEVILLQIANIESEQDIEGIDMVKRGVDMKGIFLKININEMRNIKDASDSENINSDKIKKNI
ncbi:MAG: anti-sigma factor [Rhodothermaceae bacterium]